MFHLSHRLTTLHTHPAMSSAEQYVRTEFPVIDSDPHFARVVRYMRGSDYVAWGGLTVGGPAVLLALGKKKTDNRTLLNHLQDWITMEKKPSTTDSSVFLESDQWLEQERERREQTTWQDRVRPIRTPIAKATAAR